MRGWLSNTRVLDASFDGNPATSWGGLLKVALKVAYARLGSFAAVSVVTSAPLRPGRLTSRGFGYIEELDASVQGADANKSWERTVQVARALRVPVSVRFERRGGGAVQCVAWKP